MRVLHLSMTGWNEREGIARAIAELVRRSPHEHHYAGPGQPSDHFAAVHGLRARVIPAPWSPALRAVLRSARPAKEIVGGSLQAEIRGRTDAAPRASTTRPERAKRRATSSSGVQMAATWPVARASRVAGQASPLTRARRSPPFGVERTSRQAADDGRRRGTWVARP